MQNTIIGLAVGVVSVVTLTLMWSTPIDLMIGMLAFIIIIQCASWFGATK